MDHRRHRSVGSAGSGGSSQPYPPVVPSSRKRPRPPEPPPKPADDDMFAVTPEHFQLAKKKLQLENHGQIGGSGLPIPVVPSTSRRSTGSVPLPSETRMGHHPRPPPISIKAITDKATPVRRDNSFSSSGPHPTGHRGTAISVSTEEIDAETQRLLRFFGCTIIRRAAVLLKVPQNTVSSAHVYFHRFYAFHSMKHFDVALIARSCLYLACKAEESLRKARDVLNTMSYVLNPAAPALKIGKTYWDLRDDMVAAEQVLLRVLAFNLTVDQPFKYLLNYIYSLRGSEALAQVAWSLASDCFYLPTFIDKPMNMLACAAIYLASQILGEKILPDARGKEWCEIFGCKKEEVEELAASLLGAIEDLNGIPFQAAHVIYQDYLSTFAPPTVTSLVKPATVPVPTKSIVS